MAFWDRFKTKKSPTQRRNFTAAGFGRLFNDWNASNSSPDQELEYNLKVLRDRSRDLERNNPIIQRYLQLAKQGVVGPNQGFKIKVRSRDSNGQLDSAANDLIEREWYKFCENPEASGLYTMHDIYCMIITGLLRDGEVLTQYYRDPRGFKLSFLEPDFLDSKLNKQMPDNRQIRMGVEIENYTLKPVAFHLVQNPYNASAVDDNLITRKRVPAEDMLHIYVSERFGQTRGYPRIANVMTAIKWLQDFRYSELIASKSAASKMAFLKTETGDGYGDGYLDGDEGYMPTMDFSPGTIEMLPKGYDIEFMDNRHPNTNLDQYDKAMIRTIASGLGVSYSSLSNDLSGTSYSSARVGMLDERDFYKQQQTKIIEGFCKPVYQEWLKHSLTIGSLSFPNGALSIESYDKFSDAVDFIPRGYSWVDPQKEITASTMALNNGLMTMQDVLNQYGKELSTHFSELDAEKELANRFDIELAFQPFGNAYNPQDGTVFDQQGDNDSNLTNNEGDDD